MRKITEEKGGNIKIRRKEIFTPFLLSGKFFDMDPTQATTTSPPLLELFPDEIAIHTLRFCDFSTLCQFSKTCWKAYSLTREIETFVHKKIAGLFKIIVKGEEAEAIQKFQDRICPLKTLEFPHLKLGFKEVKFLTDFIGKSPEIQVIDLRGNEIEFGSAAFKQLVKSLPKCTALRVLRLPSTQYHASFPDTTDHSSVTPEKILLALNNVTQLRELSLENNRYNPACIKMLTQLLNQNPHLRKLEVPGPFSEHEGEIQLFKQAMEDHSGLREVHFSFPYGYRKASHIILDALFKMKRLESLHLDQCCIHSESIKLFLQALSKPDCSLEKLSCPLISSEAIFFQVISVNQSLKSLHYSGSIRTDALANNLKLNKHLEDLRLETKDPPKKHIVMGIIQALSENNSLKSLSLWVDFFSHGERIYAKTHLTKILTAIKKNSTLERLELICPYKVFYLPDLEKLKSLIDEYGEAERVHIIFKAS